MSKVYCRYCGAQIDENATFCTHCGMKQIVDREQSEENKRIREEELLKKEEKKRKRRKRLRKTGKIFLLLLLIALIVGAGILGYKYYFDEYLPNKRLDKACIDILSKMRSSDKVVCTKYCKAVLSQETTWGYKDVEDYSISERMSEYRDEAFNRLEAEAHNGNVHAQMYLGDFYYFDDDYIENDTVKAVYWWNEAAKQKYTPAYDNMGIAYETGEGVQKDIRKAIFYYKEGAENNNPYAQVNYGRLYRDGIKIKTGSHKEIRKKYGYYYHGDLADKVREYYDDKKGEHVTEYYVDVDDYKWLIPQDIEKAKYWWRKAVAQGNLDAKELLEKVYE